MTGFVSFVSSGPGEPELLTLKAVKWLKAAYAVLFDDLLSGPMLAHARPGGRPCVGVGKRAGRASPRQIHVSRLLVDYAKSGLRVVRLKSGDAGIFGRLEEEVIALRATGINYDIIPGVTTACAAAAAAGIPLTRRQTAQRVQFVTGADVTGNLPDNLNMAALCDATATTVVFMGGGTFPRLARELMAHGLSPHTRALMAEALGRPEQKLTFGDLEGLATKLGDERTRAPVLILYGPLVDNCDD